MTQRIRVGIVFGGASSEHDVSCMTAGGVSRAIDADRFDVIGIGITLLVVGFRCRPTSCVRCASRATSCPG